MSCLLEVGASTVARSWINKIHPQVYNNLRKHRDYKDGEVRALLRAVRNMASAKHRDYKDGEVRTLLRAV